MESGVARVSLDLERYREQLEARLGRSRELMRGVFNKAKTGPKRIVLSEKGLTLSISGINASRSRKQARA